MGYTQWGAFAEGVSARSALLWPVPPGWSAEEGAAFPVNFFTAYFAYWKAGLVPHGKDARVLIHAVAGGVGHVPGRITALYHGLSVPLLPPSSVPSCWFC